MRLIGVITVPTTETKNNTTTAVPFVLPKTGKLKIQTDTAGVLVELGIGAAFATTAARGLRLAQFETTSFAMAGIQSVLSVIHPGAGTATIKVFAEASS